MPAAVLAVAGLLLGACTVPVPDVTFFGNRVASVAGPSLWCRVDATISEAVCTVDRAEDGAARLSLRPGQGVQINVPGEVGDQPWAVVFSYTDDGGRHDARTAIFPPGQRLSYVLEAPSTGARITRVEVQSGLTLVQGADGGVDVAVLRSWVLLVDAAPPQGT